MALPIVKIRGVSKSFGSKQVLSDINLDINEGEIFGIIGASGAGKTTLLESMVGFYSVDKGEIEYRKDNPAAVSYASINLDPSIKKIIGFSTQDTSFYEKLTIKENLDYFAKLYGIPEQFVEARIKRVLELIELTGEENTIAGELSGGMKKRLDIGCSLINDPKILILDEPTADLDPILRKHIWQLIKKINSLGKTIIISSHFLEEMDELCTRIALIFDRSIAHAGTTEEFRSKYSCNQEIVLNLRSQNYMKIAKMLSGLPLSKIIQRGNRMVIYTHQAEFVLKELINILEKEKEDIIGLEIKRPSMDEIFAAITRSRENEAVNNN